MAVTQDDIKNAFIDAMREISQNKRDGLGDYNFGARTSGRSDIDTSSFKGLNDTIDKLTARIDNLNDEFEKRKNEVLYFKNGKPRKGKTEEYLKLIEEKTKARLELEKEQDKYIFDELEISKLRLSAAKKNLAYQEEQARHSVTLADIEADARKKHNEQIKAIFEAKEKVRRNGLANYETATKNITDYVNTIKSDVTEKAKDKNGNEIDVFSARKELQNKLILGPLKEKWLRAFGGTITDKDGRTQSFGTTIAKAISSGLTGLDKAGKSIATGKMDVSGMASNLSSKLMSTGNPYAMAGGAILSILKTAFDMYSKVDKAASDYARKVGGGAIAQDKMRRSASELARAMSNVGQRAYDADVILGNMAATSEVFGRNLEYLSTADIKAITDLKDFGISNDTISQFDTLGISLERISQEFASIYGSAGKKGLNATSVIKSLSSNMKMAQNFTFERGRKALFDMAEKSAQLKFNLRDAEAFANKVGTLEGAMKSAAQLSVLGGGFAMQGNPMTLLYNALNDMEGLQDQMLSMTKDLVYWDHNKGQFEMSVFDRQRLKAMSEATGIDYSELTSQAFNQGRLDRISQQLPAGTKKEVAEYIKNIAFIDEKGQARVQFHNDKGENEGPAKLLKDLTDEEIKRLKAESDAKDVKDNATVGDIMNSTRSIQDKLDDLIKWLKAQITPAIMGIFDAVTFFNSSKLDSYGLNEKEKAQYDRIRNVLSDNVLTTESFKNRGLTSEDLELLKKMDVLGKNGEYQGRKHTSMSEGDTYRSYEITSMYANAIGKEPTAYAKGGYTGDGNPDEIAGLVHKGEYVIDADTTKSMFSDVKNGKNPMGFKDFVQRIDNGVKTRVDDFIDGKQSMKVEFGTLHLELGGITKDVDMNAYANFLLSNDSFIMAMIQKMTTAHNYGYRKDDFQFPMSTNSYSTRV